MNEMTFTVEFDDEGTRIDRWLSDKIPDISRSSIQKLIGEGMMSVNCVKVAKNYKIRHGDIIHVKMPEEEQSSPIAQNIPLDILYEDDDLLVVNKAKGMVVHPGAGHRDNTLVNALLFHCKGKLSTLNGDIRPGIVHRIDKDTSGLLVVAKNNFTHEDLARQLKERTFKRQYETIVYGSLRKSADTINAPIGRHGTNRTKMCVTEHNSKNAITHFNIIEQYAGYAYVRVMLETGRTHQIRVHMDYIGHPIVGDEVYGVRKRNSKTSSLRGQCLHSKMLGFTHPRSGDYIEIESELPEYFRQMLTKLRTKE
ncbi:MAG: RluA family pseudouridine synthase [Clostridiales bacterium]|nr:RluA family pseudouridine synthase [Clostridiales bacterium]